MIRALSIVVATLLFSYIVFVFFYFGKKRHNPLCTRMEVVVKDSLDKHFVSDADIIALLKRSDLNPVDRRMRKVNTHKIESALLKNEMIAKVEAYKTPSGLLKLEVTQKVPILRILGEKGNFYVDNEGKVMPVSLQYVAHVPLASGYVEKGLATTDLYKFALFLQKDAFWDNQIDQIYVDPSGQVELIPRVGNHRIVMGTLENFEEKLANLKLFYDQAIPIVGWEKYSVISLKFKNQIVCTKK